jgi:hypothetical protein
MGIHAAIACNQLFLAVLVLRVGDVIGALDGRLVWHAETGNGSWGTITEGERGQLREWARGEWREIDDTLDDVRDGIPDGLSVCVIGWYYVDSYEYDGYVEAPELVATRNAPPPDEPWWVGTKEAVREFLDAGQQEMSYWEAAGLEDQAERFGLTPEEELRYFKAVAEWHQGAARLTALFQAA